MVDTNIFGNQVTIEREGRIKSFRIEQSTLKIQKKKSKNSPE